MDDHELIALVRQGHVQKYCVLVERHQRLVFGLAYHLLRSREEAEDTAQEAFLRVYGRLKEPGEIDFLPYLKKVTSNLCMDRLRRRKTEQTHLQQSSTLLDTAEYHTPEDDSLLHAEHRMLRQALERIPEMYRQVLLLHYSAGKTYEEIAIALSQPMSIVKNRIFRGKKLLKDEYLKLEGSVSREL